MSHATGMRLIAGFLGFFLCMGLWFITRNSPTFDEPGYYYPGYAYLTRGDFSLSSEHPPLFKQAAALPVYLLARWRIVPAPRFVTTAENPLAGLDFLYRSPLSASVLLLLGRLPMLLFGLLTIAVIARWAYRLWGMPAAVVATGLAVTEPTLIAHSGVITPDIALTFFFTAVFYLAWEYVEHASTAVLLLLGVALGGALGSKHPALVALPVLLVIATASAPTGAWAFPRRRRSTAASRWHAYAEAALVLALLLGIATFTLLCLYAFHGLSLWWGALVHQLKHASRGHLAFFWGRYSAHGWWYYFPVAFALKTPTLTLAAIVVSLLLPRVGVPLRRRELLCLLLPALAFSLMAAWSGINIGVRYILPVYPLLLVAASRLATFPLGRRALAPAVLLGAIACNAAATLWLAPHFLASANAIAGGPRGIARYLSDSNVDWGQGLAELKRYMDREKIASLYLSYFGPVRPSDYGIHYQYLPSFMGDDVRDSLPASARNVVAVSLTNLQGVYLADHDLYAWLRARAPIATVGYSIYVYDLSGEADFHCRLSDLYAAAGEHRYQAIERRKCDGS